MSIHNEIDYKKITLYFNEDRGITCKARDHPVGGRSTFTIRALRAPVFSFSQTLKQASGLFQIKNAAMRRILSVAEREGFEPPDPCRSTVFKTAALDRSAISPGAKLDIFWRPPNNILPFNPAISPFDHHD